jgi:hypothetical protein
LVAWAVFDLTPHAYILCVLCDCNVVSQSMKSLMLVLMKR